MAISDRSDSSFSGAAFSAIGLGLFCGYGRGCGRCGVASHEQTTNLFRYDHEPQPQIKVIAPVSDCS